ncbi:MAG: enoyl-CoA hydratase-related protein [Candidatus Binataceae bacterium]
MPYRHIIYQKNDRIARLILNRPRYRNAQSRLMLEEMDAAFNEAMADDDVRVVVLSGAGDHFSSGHDLGTPEEVEDARHRPYGRGIREQHKRSWDLYLSNPLRWRDLPKPTIAQVHGYCIFGGWMIASAMDLIVAADDAMFLPSLTQYFSAPWDIGVRKAKEVLFQSRFMDAHEAMRAGFVNQVVPRADLDKESLALAGRIAQTDRFVLRLTKLAVNLAQDAMGFPAAIRGAHSQHFLLAAGGALRNAGDFTVEGRRMPGVEQALKKPGRAG